ncbi:MAG: hypothetical protein KY429_04730 [Actinobacteria bacterium]|nr:hypothetical protein [Actinomycetota bacterium]
MKRFLVLVAVFGLFLSGCDRARQEIDQATDTSEEEPKQATFELQGVVVEASGSAALAGTRTETTQTPVTPSPTGDDEESTPSPEGSPTTVTTAVIERSAPGSIALKLTAFSIEESECLFSEGDVLVVPFTKSTNFEPADLTEVRGFPNNLQGLTVLISGTVLGDDCLLLATEVSVQEEGTERDDDVEATSTPAGEARRSPTPTPTD